MPTLDELIKKRIKESEKAAADTSKLVRVLQGLGYTAVLEWAMGSLTIKDGRIDTTAANLGKVSGLYRVFGKWQDGYKATMLGRVLEWSGKIFDLNEQYFEDYEPSESVSDKARRLTLQRWGYDGKALIPGGYFESLFSSGDTAQRVARSVNQAILQKMTLAEFQSTFRAVFVGKDGKGMLERHWNTNSFDLYQRIDRTANLIYAEELGLTWAIYSHTFEEDSRAWCIKHGNKVFSKDEILDWKNFEWAGKNKFYEPFTDCGGYNCRGHWSWISEGVAKSIKSKQK